MITSKSQSIIPVSVQLASRLGAREFTMQEFAEAVLDGDTHAAWALLTGVAKIPFRLVTPIATFLDLDPDPQAIHDR